jgi:hypothetical protein
MYAPLLDPGGFPSTRLIALRIAAFRRIENVGFHAYTLALIVHDYTNFGARSRSLHPRSPWLRTPVTRLTRRVRYRPVG